MRGVGAGEQAAARAHRVRMQEASTALMSRERKPPLSSTCKALMVAPPGEQTLSFSCPGCCSESSSILAAPCSQRGADGCGHPPACQALLPAPDTMAPVDTPPIHPSAPASRPARGGSHQRVMKNTDQQSLGPEADCQAPGKPHLHAPISQGVHGCERLQGEGT